MRYRSATVADSHGLPLYLERLKERANLRRLDEQARCAQSFCLCVSCHPIRVATSLLQNLSTIKYAYAASLSEDCIWST
jgi:hypothetical protein